MLATIRKKLVWILSHPTWTGIAALVTIIAIIVGFLVNDPDAPIPTSPGVYSLRSMSTGEKLTAHFVEARGNAESVTHKHPVRVEQVIGLCLTESVEANTQLTLKHLTKCSVTGN